MEQPHTERGTLPGKGTLVIIGGHEDKQDSREILKEVARLSGKGKLVIATLASHTREGYFESYQKAFDDLETGELVELYLDERSDANKAAALDTLRGATGVLFPAETSSGSPA
ncbi:hypothetical protein ACFSC4_23930 [Deinococcus malanensis]|uniref:hypothetical protein n=1 Tax=Deinococcus malanensis TaxID=1706855 RepID=UPI00362A6CB0